MLRQFQTKKMELTYFLIQIVIGCLVITGAWAACGSGMVLEPIADALEAILPRWFCKPLFVCPACMSSAWGTAVWFFTGGDVSHWPLYVFALCGAMHLISIHLLSNDRQ